MNRRRRPFTPDSEDLERRALLSGAGAETPSAPAEVQTAEPTRAATALELARARNLQNRQNAQNPRQGAEQARENARQQIIQMRLRRIDALPAFLRSLDPGRRLPEPATSQIQDVLRNQLGQLRPPADAIARGFIDVLRTSIADASIQQETLAQMNNALGFLLNSAGMRPENVATVQASMLDFARADASASQPMVLFTNDFALITQTILGTGRPINPRFDPDSPLVTPTLPGGSLADPNAPISGPTGRFLT